MFPDSSLPSLPEPTDTKDLSRLPPPASDLVGRSNELRQLTRALKNNDKFLVHICASGGVGMRNIIWVETREESVFLELLSLFDRPMGLVEKEILVKEAACASPLRSLNDVGWHQLEKTLERAGLLIKPRHHRFIYVNES